MSSDHIVFHLRLVAMIDIPNYNPLPNRCCSSLICGEKTSVTPIVIGVMGTGICKHLGW
jgi:hypothetical protein